MREGTSFLSLFFVIAEAFPSDAQGGGDSLGYSAAAGTFAILTASVSSTLRASRGPNGSTAIVIFSRTSLTPAGRVDTRTLTVNHWETKISRFPDSQEIVPVPRAVSRRGPASES